MISSVSHSNDSFKCVQYSSFKSDYYYSTKISMCGGNVGMDWDVWILQTCMVTGSSEGKLDHFRSVVLVKNKTFSYRIMCINESCTVQ